MAPRRDIAGARGGTAVELAGRRVPRAREHKLPRRPHAVRALPRTRRTLPVTHYSTYNWTGFSGTSSAHWCQIDMISSRQRAAAGQAEFDWSSGNTYLL